MQKEHPETPKRRIRRIRNASTPEVPKKNNNADTSKIIRASSSRHRATMAPGDFHHPQAAKELLPRKKLGADRMSILPSQLPLEGPRNPEVDNNDAALKLLYQEYLQSAMIQLVLTKKSIEKKNVMTAELATLAKENDQDQEKLFKLKMREIDISCLSMIQKKMDAKMKEVDELITSGSTWQAVPKVLSQLYSCLKPLDVLQCKNIILPSTPEEWKETEENIRKCVSTLESIMSVIGSTGTTYKEIYDGIQEFISSHGEIEENIKRLEETLCDLQALVLKTASLCLTEQDDVLET